MTGESIREVEDIMLEIKENYRQNCLESKAQTETPTPLRTMDTHREVMSCKGGLEKAWDSIKSIHMSTSYSFW